MARLELDLTAADARTLRGALIAAKATELAEMHRRARRHSAGYGSDSARTVMTAEVDQHRRRIELLDLLISAMGHEADAGGR